MGSGVRQLPGLPRLRDASPAAFGLEDLLQPEHLPPCDVQKGGRRVHAQTDVPQIPRHGDTRKFFFARVANVVAVPPSPWLGYSRERHL
jgi:hypothetical protein